jgi:hypothetical protein
MLVLTWKNRQIMMQHNDSKGKDLCTSVNAGKGIDPDIKIKWIAYELPGGLLYETQSGKPWPGFSEP